MNDNQQKLVRLATKILLKALKTFYKEYLEQEHSNKKEKHQYDNPTNHFFEESSKDNSSDRF